jgi:hypothetical protein
MQLVSGTAPSFDTISLLNEEQNGSKEIVI